MAIAAFDRAQAAMAIPRTTGVFFFFFALKVHCHAIQWFFVDFFAAEKWRRSHRGRTRSDQSRRRPGKNPSIAIARLGLREREWESKACDTTFVAKASSRLSSCTCFSPSCSAEVPSIFSSFCLFLGGTPTIVHSPNVDASVPVQASSSQICSRQIQFLKVSPEQGSETGEARLAGAHNNTCQSTRKVLSSNWVLPISTAREKGIDRKVDLHACFNNSWRSRIYASVQAAEVALNIGPPRTEESASNRSTQRRIVWSTVTMENRTAAIIFPTTKWRKKSLNSVTVHL